MAGFGVFSVAGAEPRVGWRAGDEVVDLSALGELFRGASLNPLLAHRVEAPAQDPPPLPHLGGGRDWGLDKARKILETHQPEPLDPAIGAEMAKIIASIEK